MESVKLRARAKINLSIDIKDVLEDGYHEVEMIMQAVDLSDYIIIRKSKEGIKLVCSNPVIPLERKNIVYKTIEVMMERYSIASGVEVFIEKNIPIAAGLAGGSSDSAAAIIGMDRLFDLGLGEEEMVEISRLLGSDIAFCLTGGTQIATGKGTNLERLRDFGDDISVLICKPNYFVSTKNVYSGYDEMVSRGYEFSRPDNDIIVEGLEKGDFDMVISGMKNVLEPVTKSSLKEIDKIEDIMNKFGARISMMSGSGPTVFGFFKDESDAKKCAKELRKKYIQTFVTKCSNKGVDICGH